MTRLTVFSYKDCWPSASSPTGYATDGGFPFQMGALSELFDATTVVVPCDDTPKPEGEVPLVGHNLSIVPLTPLSASRGRRKLRFIFWLARNFFTLVRGVLKADAVHTPIPADVGTIGMLLAFLLRKPLFVRHCGNWLVPVTVAEHFWKWFMEKFAGGRNVMLATGGGTQPPSLVNRNVRWIFSTTLTENELRDSREPRKYPTDGCVRLVIACRQDREKGTGVVIETLPLVLEHFPQASLDVVGDGRALPEFQKLAADLGITHRVTFHGKVNHTRVMELLRQAHIFCYPTSASEGFPKVALEALACGLPLIATPVSVLSELIDTRCGVLINEATPHALRQAIDGVLADADSYESMSAQALETASRYSLERWRDSIGDLLRAEWGEILHVRHKTIRANA